MNPALSQEFHLFCEQEQFQKHPTLNKKSYLVPGTVYTALLDLILLHVSQFSTFNHSEHILAFRALSSYISIRVPDAYFLLFVSPTLPEEVILVCRRRYITVDGPQ